MSNVENLCELIEQKSETDLKYFFVSKGKEDIIKAIRYSFVQKLGDKKVYNLGFGDYNIENNTIIDSVNSNNGDAYKVFNTVLSTISSFFEIHFPATPPPGQGAAGRYSLPSNTSSLARCDGQGRCVY